MSQNRNTLVFSPSGKLPERYRPTKPPGSVRRAVPPTIDLPESLPGDLCLLERRGHAFYLTVDAPPPHPGLPQPSYRLGRYSEAKSAFADRWGFGASTASRVVCAAHSNRRVIFVLRDGRVITDHNRTQPGLDWSKIDG